MKKIILFISLVFLLQSCVTNKKHNQHLSTPITTKKLVKDIKYVERQLKRMHPDLYWYVSEEELHYSFDSLRRHLNEPLTPNEFQLKLAPIVAKVKQGHISLRPLMPAIDKSKEERKKYEKSRGPFNQLSYYWSQGKLYVLKNNSKEKFIVAGSEIVSIENITPQYLYEKYKNTMTSDGYIQSFLDKRFNMSVLNYYSLELGLKDSIHLILKCSDSIYHAKIYREFRTTTPSSLTNQEITDTLKNPKNLIIENTQKNKIPNPNNNKRIFGYDKKLKINSKQLTYPVKKDSTIALLTIRDFSRGSAKKAYQSIFTELEHKEVKALIIDLRGNLGGKISDIQLLYSYLVKEDNYQFVQPAKVTSRWNLPFYAIAGKPVWNYVLLSPYYAGYSVYLWSSTHKKEGDYFYRLEGSRIRKAKKERFKGTLYVLTDGATYSASSILSSNLKGKNRAFFVGDETGGAFNGTVAGRMPKFELPHSKLKFSFGVMSIRPTEQSDVDGRGILPDMQIIPSVDEVIRKKDPAMDWILEQLKTNNLVVNKNSNNEYSD